MSIKIKFTEPKKPSYPTYQEFIQEQSRDEAGSSDSVPLILQRPCPNSCAVFMVDGVACYLSYNTVLHGKPRNLCLIPILPNSDHRREIVDPSDIADNFVGWITEGGTIIKGHHDIIPMVQWGDVARSMSSSSMVVIRKQGKQSFGVYSRSGTGTNQYGAQYIMSNDTLVEVLGYIESQKESNHE